MRKSLATAVLAFLLAGPALAVAPPDDATVVTSGAATQIRFADGSIFQSSIGATNAKGAQAVAWFLRETDEPALKVLDTKDVASISISTASESISFADGSAILYSGTAMTVGKGLAEKYHALIAGANRKAGR